MTIVNFRADAETEALLAQLAAPGESRSDTIRAALRDAARLRAREAMRLEALTVARDADDLAEARAVREHLDDLRAG